MCKYCEYRGALNEDYSAEVYIDDSNDLCIEGIMIEGEEGQYYVSIKYCPWCGELLDNDKKTDN